MRTQEGYGESFVGKRFGSLLVTKYIGKEIRNGIRRTVLLCLCDCGKEKDVVASHLVKGNARSCGCMNVVKNGKAYLPGGPKDLTGKTVGYCTIVAYAGVINGYRSWNCQCLCGNMFVLGQTYLKKEGSTANCGCALVKAKMLVQRGVLPEGLDPRLTLRLSKNRLWQIYNARKQSLQAVWPTYKDFSLEMGPGYLKILDEKQGIPYLRILDPRSPPSKGNYTWTNQKGGWTRPDIAKTHGGMKNAEGRLLTRKEMADMAGISDTLFYKRQRLGWTLEQIVSNTPPV